MGEKEEEKNDENSGRDVIASSRLSERRSTGTPYARANCRHARKDEQTAPYYFTSIIHPYPRKRENLRRKTMETIIESLKLSLTPYIHFRFSLKTLSNRCNGVSGKQEDYRCCHETRSCILGGSLVIQVTTICRYQAATGGVQEVPGHQDYLQRHPVFPQLPS